MKKVGGFLRVGMVKRERPEDKPQQFYVRVVTARKGGEFYASQDIPVISGLRTAVETAEMLQADFDADCEPSRAYVLDAGRIAIVAAGEKYR
jgi:hypothetical protein